MTLTNKPAGETGTMSRSAVILLAYGGPDRLEDIGPFLQEIRGGRPTPQPLIEEITERYRLIGGRSPLLEITSSTAQKLSKLIDLPVYVGMRHWDPTINDVVRQMAVDGIDNLVGICMAPHYSELSIGKYRAALVDAVQRTGKDLSIDFVSSWHLQPNYLHGLAANASLALERWPKGKRDQVMKVFTAHSLPANILEHGDPYDQQLHETAREMAHILDLPKHRWLFSYQSAAKTGVPWLGPQIEEVVEDLANEGHKDLLIAPIGFIADHVEILYDLDIAVQQIAGTKGVRVERSEMLNDADDLVLALADLVDKASVPVF